MAQKATERATRIAVVRSPVCNGVPALNTRDPLAINLDTLTFGMSCSVDPQLCDTVATISCPASTNAVGSEIYAQIRTLLPTNATAENLHFTYTHDPDLGFLGGPYTPIVTVDLRDLDFEFVTPVGALAAIIGAGSANNIGEDFAFPSMSNSLPAEILLDGDAS